MHLSVVNEGYTAHSSTHSGRLQSAFGRAQPQAGATQSAHQFATLDLLGPGGDEFGPVFLGDVVVITLKTQARDAGAIGELVEFVVRGVAHEVAPLLAPPPPPGLVDQDRHDAHRVTVTGTLTR